MTLPEPLPFLPGTVLTSPEWLSARVTDAGKLWRTRDSGTAATLWWYSASVLVLRPSVHAFVHTGRAASLAGLRVILSPLGLLERVVTSSDAADVAPGSAAFGQHLDDALMPILSALSDVGPVPIQRLWALTGDALGNRLLAELQAGSGLSPPADAVAELAASITAGSQYLQAPQYAAISAGPSRPPMTFLQRGSCCMLYRLSGQEVCASCPRQTPAERRSRLESHARWL